MLGSITNSCPHHRPAKSRRDQTQWSATGNLQKLQSATVTHHGQGQWNGLSSATGFLCNELIIFGIKDSVMPCMVKSGGAGLETHDSCWSTSSARAPKPTYFQGARKLLFYSNFLESAPCLQFNKKARKSELVPVGPHGMA
jgi:hypothetical protein